MQIMNAAIVSSQSGLTHSCDCALCEPCCDSTLGF